MKKSKIMETRKEKLDVLIVEFHKRNKLLEKENSLIISYSNRINDINLGDPLMKNHIDIIDNLINDLSTISYKMRCELFGIRY